MLHHAVASVAITHRCNYRCSHCGVGAMVSGNGAVQSEPDRKKLRTLFRALEQYGIRTIIISGGEPFLRHDLPLIVDDAGACGLTCGILTNGTHASYRRIKELYATGAVSFIRLSMEGPESISGGKTHDPWLVLRRCTEIAEAGLIAGVNMTLMPDNLCYLAECADRCKNAGSSFFRAVPILPVGRGSTYVPPTTFFGACMGALLELHTSYAASRDMMPPSLKMRILTRDSFACSCAAGIRSLAFGVDGSVHICSMITMEGRSMSCFNHPLAACLEYLLRRKRYLQRIIMDGCRNCRNLDRCRGGCIAEWYARGRPHGQPICYKNIMHEVLLHSPIGPAVMNTAVTLADTLDLNRMVHGECICLRSLPLWTVRFA